MKNDVTYEYRVFTNRLVDVESMEVGKCTSKVLKDLKSKDKVDGRFFHTSDTDEWFFCWNGKLQKLNLKGNADVNSALEEAKKATEAAQKAATDANTAVTNAKEIAEQAQTAADDAKKAADAASDAVKTIEGKADTSYVDAVKSDVKKLSDNVDEIETSLEGLASEDYVNQEIAKIQNSSYDDTEIRNQLENKANVSDLNSHKNDADIHVTLEDKTKWNSIEQSAKEYADSLVKDSEGKSLFDAAGAATTALSSAKVYADSLVKDAEGNSLFDAAGSANIVLTDAKTYSDGLNTAMDARVDVLEKINHDAYIAADGQVLADAKTYADGLSTKYDAAGSAATAEQNAKTYADSLLASIVEDLEEITNKILGA